MVKIPTKLEDLVPPAALGKILEVLNQPALSGAVKEALQRVGLKDVSPVEQVQEAWQQAKDWVGQFANRWTGGRSGNPQWINASGELLPVDALGFPMAPTVAEAYAGQAIHFHDCAQLEQRCHQIAVKLFDCQDALLISSLPAAVMLVRNQFNQSAMSRSDAVRVPGFGDIRCLLSTSTRPLLEVGATNGASINDWGNIQMPPDSAVWLVSPNGLSANETDNQRAAAIDFSRTTQATVVELLCDGVVANHSAELTMPVVGQRLHSGADLVILPLDGFLGGPNGAIVVGDAKRIKSLRTLVQSQGWSLRGAELAATAAALERTQVPIPFDTGVLDLLNVSLANLKDRAKRLSLQLVDTEYVGSVEIIERSSPLGASPWNRYHLTNAAVAAVGKTDAAALAQKLRSGELGTPIVTAIEGPRIVLDLRFVPPRDDQEVVRALTRSVEQPEA